MKIKVGIIGAGNIAGGYDEQSGAKSLNVFTHAKAYRSLNELFTLCVVVDKNIEKAFEFAKTWNVSQAETDYRDLAKYNLDVVSVCTPDGTHYEIVKYIIQMRLAKTIFCEKPVGLTSHEIRNLILLSKKYNVNVVVNFQRRWEEVHSNFRSLVAKNKIEILGATFHYIKGLHHIGITAVDTIIYLFGFPKSVVAFDKYKSSTNNEDCYDFVLFYNNFNVVFKSMDRSDSGYKYHAFDLSIYSNEGMICFVDNSNSLIQIPVSDYIYGSVKTLDSKASTTSSTCYSTSMINAVKYIASLDSAKHKINTLDNSLAAQLIVEAVVDSYNDNMKLIQMEFLQ